MLNKNSTLFFIILLIIKIVLGHFFSLICPYILNSETCNVNYTGNTQNLGGIFFITVFFGPLLETALNQYLPIEGYYKYYGKKAENRKEPIIWFTAIIFGLGHFYNILTVVHAMIGGIILATVYIHFRERGKSGFFFTFLIHALYNLYGFLIDDVLHLVT
jgi:uncharacterized protein